jgi:uncharacterized protein
MCKNYLLSLVLVFTVGFAGFSSTVSNAQFLAGPSDKEGNNLARPSFDCRGTNLAADELAICRSEPLSRLDRNLAELYATMRDQPGVRDAQRTWLSRRSNCHDNTACIADAYRTRIGQLQASVAQPTPAPIQPSSGTNAGAPENGCAHYTKVCNDIAASAQRFCRMASSGPDQELIYSAAERTANYKDCMNTQQPSIENCRRKLEEPACSR